MKKQTAIEFIQMLNCINCDFKDECETCSYGIAIKCMKELEQYRALDLTPELIEAMQGHNIALINDLGEYQALGTVEELKEAREKQIPKKPNKVNGEAFCMTIDGKADYEITLLCPTCGNTHLAYGFPCKCGQLLNWEEGGTSD